MEIDLRLRSLLRCKLACFSSGDLIMIVMIITMILNMMWMRMIMIMVMNLMILNMMWMRMIKMWNLSGRPAPESSSTS